MFFRSLFPDNLVDATFRSVSVFSHSSYSHLHIFVQSKICMTFMNGTGNASQRVDPDIVMKLSPDQRVGLHEIPNEVVSNGMNIMGLVLFSVALGVVISVMGEDGRPLKQFFKSLEGASMRLISLVIWYVFLIDVQSTIVYSKVFTDGNYISHCGTNCLDVRSGQRTSSSHGLYDYCVDRTRDTRFDCVTTSDARHRSTVDI